MIIVSVYVHCKTHRKRSGIEMNETLNLHRQRTKWTADIELDNFFLEGSIMSKLANGHFAMLNSSVAPVEVPSIST